MLKQGVMKVTFILAGLVVGGLLFEIAMRIVGFSYPSFYTWDEYRGYALRPGARGWSRDEGEAYIRINSEGLRDREHHKEKPANTLRVAILGDSYAEAKQVPMESTFWTILKQELERCPAASGREVEVINFGVAGYGTAQELMTLRHHVWDYSPDIVILAFTTGNDITDNSHAFGTEPMRPFFVYKDGTLVLDDSFRSLPGFRARQTIVARFGYWALSYSRVMELFNQVKNRLATGLIQIPQKGMASQTPPPSAELGLDEMVYSDPRDRNWKEAWQITEKLILLIRNEVRQKGADFLLVTLSNADQVHPDPVVRQAFMNRVGIQNLFYPDLRIKALGEKERFPVVNLAQDFQAYAEQHQVFLHGFGTAIGRGHWNSEGHRLAGKTIAQKLCQDRLKYYITK